MRDSAETSIPPTSQNNPDEQREWALVHPSPDDFPVPGIANSMPAMFSLKTERLEGVAVAAVLNDAVGVGVVPATAAAVSARDAPRAA
jgi:hypothetical protein